MLGAEMAGMIIVKSLDLEVRWVKVVVRLEMEMSGRGGRGALSR